MPHEPIRYSYPYPLRPDFIAILQLPHDLSEEEAARLIAFVKTLVVPNKETGRAELPPSDLPARRAITDF